MSGAGRPLNRNFWLLWQGQLVSLVGTQVFRLALVIWLKDAANSATLLGLLMAAFAAPGLLIGPFAGVIADRYPRRRVLIACDVAQGAAVLSLGLLWLVIPPSHVVSIVALFALALIGGTTTAVFQPATIAIVPELVSREGLPRANSLVQGSFQVGALVAQSLAGVSVRLIGASVLAVADAASYFYSAASAAFIRPLADAPRITRPSATRDRSFRSELRDAIAYIRSKTGLPALIVLSAALRFFIVPFTVLFAFYVDGHLHATSDWYGFLVGGMGVGAIAGVAISGAIKLAPQKNAAALMGALVVQSLALGALAIVTTPRAALALVVVAGLLSGFVNVRFTTLLQLAIAPEMRGRVFAVLRTVTDALVPVAAVLAGVTADLIGRNVPLVYGACGAALTCVSLAIAGQPACRAFLAGPARAAVPAVAAPPKQPVTVGAGG